MRVALALGAGGARGYAHIAAVEELTARGHEIVAVAGTSMGSLVGAAVATDKLAELKEFALTVKPVNVVRMLGLGLPASGFASAAEAMKRLRGVIGTVRIEDCAIPYTAVAADLVTQEEVWISTGDIVSAMRASVAIPVLFTPVVREGRTLLDGGCINPLPLEPLRDVDADAIVAVSLQEPPIHPPMKDDHLKLSLLDVGLYALDTMMSSIQRARADSAPPHVMIGIPCDIVRFLDLHQAQMVMDASREIVVKTLDEAGL